MRPNGSAADLEKRRWQAIELLKSGLSIGKIADRLGCSHSSVILWRDAFRRRGARALKAKPVPGRPKKLKPSQIKKIPRLLLRGAMSWGYSTDLWTTERVAKVIERAFEVHFHRAHVGRLLGGLGWSCQKPERRAIERNEAAIKHWKRYHWVAIKKKRSD